MGTVKLDGNTYCQWVAAGAGALAAKRDRVNDMNVFPVPDGDTGTNMGMTIGAVSTVMPDGHLGRTAAEVARAMMRAARGNSGVILSLFFRGMAKALEGREDADPATLLEAMRAGARAAENSVENPVEGTILTVMRECSAAEDDTSAFETLFDGLYERAKETLAHTPEMLPVLRKANVVDAGGYGFVCVLDGMRSAALGEELPTAGDTDTTPVARPASAFDVFSGEDIRYTFCTECLLDLSAPLAEDVVSDLRRKLGAMGDSIVLTADEEILKVHVHTDEPLTVLGMLFPLGTVRASKVENMRLQHSDLTGAALAGSPLEVKAQTAHELHEAYATHGTVTHEAPEEKTPRKRYGVFAVSPGEGFSGVFRDLGADGVVSGGQSMNPSAEDLLRGMENCPCECAILLPNNSNIIMTAKQASEFCPGCHVIVIPTKTVPQGLSALLAFDPTATPDENEQAMREAAESVTTYSLTYAVRDAELDGLQVKEGQVLGLRDGRLCVAAEDTCEATRRLFSEVPDCSAVTVYSGEGVPAAEAEQMESLLREIFADRADVCLTEGGQPLYPFVISVE